MTDRQNNTTTKITPAVPIAEDPYGPRPELGDGRYMFYIPADALVMGKGYRPSIVFDGVAGHFPNGGGDVEPWYWGDTIDKARAIARKCNETLGLSEDDELRILTSSVNAGRPADRIVEIPVEVDKYGTGLSTIHTLRVPDCLHRGVPLYNRYGIGAVARDQVGRQVHQGPEVPGPWAYAFALATVIDSEGKGSKFDSDQALAAGTEHDVTIGGRVQIDDVVYTIEAAPNHNIKLVMNPDQAERIAEQNSTRAARLATRAEAASIEAADHAAQAERIAANRPHCRPLQNLATKALSYADGSIQAARTAASSAGYLADRIVEGKFDRSDEYLGAAAREFGIASEDRDQARAIASAAVVVAAHL
jgi:hypothetical protein